MKSESEAACPQFARSAAFKKQACLQMQLMQIVTTDEPAVKYL